MDRRDRLDPLRRPFDGRRPTELQELRDDLQRVLHAMVGLGEHRALELRPARRLPHGPRELEAEQRRPREQHEVEQRLGRRAAGPARSPRRRRRRAPPPPSRSPARAGCRRWRSPGTGRRAGAADRAATRRPRSARARTRRSARRPPTGRSAAGPRGVGRSVAQGSRAITRWATAATAVRAHTSPASEIGTPDHQRHDDRRHGGPAERRSGTQRLMERDAHAD